MKVYSKSVARSLDLFQNLIDNFMNLLSVGLTQQISILGYFLLPILSQP